MLFFLHKLWIQSSLLFYDCCVSNLILFCLRKKLCFVKTHLWHPKKIWSRPCSEGRASTCVCVPNKISLFQIIVTLCTLYVARLSPRGSVKLIVGSKEAEEDFMQPTCEKYALHTKYILIKLHTMPHSDWHPTFRQGDSCVFFSVSCSGWYPWWRR